MSRRALVTGIIGVVALIAGLIVWASGGTTLDRLDTTDETGSSRTLIFADTLDMISARPLLGHGYGSYEQAIPLYQTRSLGPVIFDKAHNTYLEHAAELGLPATILLYLGPVLLFGYCVRGVFVRRKDKLFPLIAVAATVLVAVHSLVDFSLQIPAIAVTYAILLGLGVAQSVPSPKAARPGDTLRE
jgi:O-antigen ligase